MQIAGTGLRMKFQHFQLQMHRYQAVRGLVLAFVQYQKSDPWPSGCLQSTARGGGRLARWLLMTDDRTQQDQLPLSQEFLRQMLETRRSTVTLTASALQDQGIIDYRRGKVRIQIREKLRHLACECYQVTNEVLRRFLKLSADEGYRRTG